MPWADLLMMRQQFLRLILQINSAILALGLVPAILFAFVSFMLFDAPSSQHDPKIWALFWSMLSFPIIIALILRLIWLCKTKSFYHIATFISFIPYIHLTAIFILIKT